MWSWRLALEAWRGVWGRRVVEGVLCFWVNVHLGLFFGYGVGDGVVPGIGIAVRHLTQ